MFLKKKARVFLMTEYIKPRFTIGQLSRNTGIPEYTLRRWENEFKLLKPVRKSSGQRIYSKSDENLVFQIRELIDKKGYTIEGVKKYLNVAKRTKFLDLPNMKEKQLPETKILREIKSELEIILQILKNNIA
jgi:DNA-binding transcriptional MerR regulator